MKTTWLRGICLTAVLLSPATFFVRGASEPFEDRQGHLSGLTARITMADGTSRIAKLEGMGCSASICSRTAVKSKAESESIVKIWLDSNCGDQGHYGKRCAVCPERRKRTTAIICDRFPGNAPRESAGRHGETGPGKGQVG
jgi:hypothetical protein